MEILTNRHSDENDEDQEEIKRPVQLCQMCNHSQFKYKCPKCFLLTCSLECSRTHKQQFNCSGVKDHIAQLNIKMQDFSLNHLRKDFSFMDSAISLSNTVKKKAFEINESVKVPKRIKNLRYFLKKKRNIMLKHSPSTEFSRSKENTTCLTEDNKNIMWTVELIFMKMRNEAVQQEDINKLYTSSKYLSRTVLNKESMINEETTLSSFINKQYLKLHYYNKDFNLFITEQDDQVIEQSVILIKSLEQVAIEPKQIQQADDSMEEGEIEISANDKKHPNQQTEKTLRTQYKEVDKQQKLREVLIGQIVFEFPTLYVLIK